MTLTWLPCLIGGFSRSQATKLRELCSVSSSWCGSQCTCVQCVSSEMFPVVWRQFGCEMVLLAKHGEQISATTPFRKFYLIGKFSITVLLTHYINNIETNFSMWSRDFINAVVFNSRHNLWMFFKKLNYSGTICHTNLVVIRRI